MKEQLQQALDMTKDDARFWVRRFTEQGTYSSQRESKAFVSDLLANATELTMHPVISDTVMLADRVGVSLSDFNENIVYETTDTDDFFDYVSKYNPYHHVFINLDHDAKTITFKLGGKTKTLELQEYSGYVYRIYKRKYFQCQTSRDLEKFMHDEFWNPCLVDVGRHALGIKKIKAA